MGRSKKNSRADYNHNAEKDERKQTNRADRREAKQDLNSGYFDNAPRVKKFLNSSQRWDD